jgi:hypothetical protein
MNFHGLANPEFRSKIPVKYYLIDFGFSVQFSPKSRPEDRLVMPFEIAREQRAPEMDWDAPYDPFPTDVYALARLFYGFFKVPSPITVQTIAHWIYF